MIGLPGLTFAEQQTRLRKQGRRTEADREAARRRRADRRKAAKFGRVIDATNASNSPDLALAKGLSRDELKAQQHKAEAKQIRKTHDKLWRLTQTCAVCGDTERETAAKHHDATHQMHEDPARSLTRGLPPAERFNLNVCGRVCAPCHQKLTDKILRVSFHDEQRRWRSDYEIINVASGHIVAHMRRGTIERALPATHEIQS